MADAVCIGPFSCPWPNRGQGRVGTTKVQGHWSQRSGLVQQQHRIVKAAWGGRCSVCGAHWTPITRLNMAAPSCGHMRVRRVPYQLPAHGPEHAVDVLLVRVPRAGAPHKGLDDDGAVAGAKATRDAVTLLLWPRDPVTGELLGHHDDSAPWLRFYVRQRPHRKEKVPRKLPPGWIPGPPDPPNQGTELCEIWIAPREDCQCYCGELRQAVRRWAMGGRTGRSNAEARREAQLLRALEEIGDEPCGCGRSMLPVRWERGL